MELNYLRCFYEVAKAGSFTEAARRLRISQSALSKSVAMLEDREGVKLLSRSKHGVALTPIGSEVFLKSERLFALAIEIEATCKGMAEVCEGPLSFGASAHIANYLLVPTLKKMLANYPDVIPRVAAGTPNEIITQILANELEFGLFFTKVNIPAIKYESIATFPMAVVCHPEIAGQPMGNISPQGLRTLIDKAGFISSLRSPNQNHPSPGLRGIISSDPYVVFESNSQEAQKSFCLAGGGIAYLARYMVETELQRGKLIEISLKKPLSVDLYLATRRGRELPVTARTFVELLRTSKFTTCFNAKKKPD